MELWNKKHAYFKEGISPNGMYLIVNNFPNQDIPIWENLKNYTKPEFYQNFAQYVFLKIMFTPGQNNEKLFLYYQNKLSDEIKLSIYNSVYSDLYRDNRDEIAEYIYKCIPEIIYDILYVGVSRYANLFWITILKNENILKEIIKRDLFKKFLMNNIASKMEIIVYMLKYKFVIDEITRLQLWVFILSTYYLSKDIWTNIALIHPEILYTIIDSNKSNNSLFLYYLCQIKSDIFWGEIGKNDKILDLFTEISKQDITKSIWNKLLDMYSYGYDDDWKIVGKFWKNVSENERIIYELFRLDLSDRILNTFSKSYRFDAEEKIENNKIIFSNISKYKFVQEKINSGR